MGSSSKRGAVGAAEDRRRRSVAEGRALVTAWRASGLSQSAFAKRRKVSAQRLSYWRLRLEGHRQAGASIKRVDDGGAAFVQVPLPSGGWAGGLVIEAPNGWRLQVPGDPAVHLAAVLSALRAGAAPC